MATRSDARNIALSLPAVEQNRERFAFAVKVKGKLKGFAWVWMERLDPKKPRVPNPGVLALRVASLAARDHLIANHPKKFFTEPHYKGFPAVLVRLAAVRPRELERLIVDAWRCQASKDLLAIPGNHRREEQ